jgi:hypothetical protein
MERDRIAAPFGDAADHCALFVCTHVRRCEVALRLSVRQHRKRLVGISDNLRM